MTVRVRSGAAAGAQRPDAALPPFAPREEQTRVTASGFASRLGWSAADARAAAVLALLAFALFAAGLRWGLPHATASDRVDSWGVDDETPLGPLAELHNILEPKPDRNLGYPLAWSFVAAGAYAPYLVYLAATGGFRGPSGTFPYGLADPESSLRTLALIAHLVSALMAVIAVLALYDAARAAWGRRVGIIAAAFAMTLYPVVYYARTGNVDGPMLCFSALAVAAYARIVAAGRTTRREVALGIFVGCALATKEAALGVFLGMPLVVLALHWREAGRAKGLAFWKPHAFALLAALLALGAMSGLFVEPGRYIAHLRFLAGRLDSLAQDGGAAAVETFAYTVSGNMAYAAAMLRDLSTTVTPAGLVIAAIGMAITAMKRERGALLIVPVLTYLLYVFLTLRASQLRYVLPAAFMLAAFIARATMAARESRRPALRVAALASCGAVLLVQLLRSADLTWQMLADSRFAAGAWLAAAARPGDRVEYFGPSQKLPPLGPEIVTERATGYFGMYARPQVDDVKVREILARWSETNPRFVVALPDHTSAPGAPHSHTFPPSLFAELSAGQHGFRVAAVFHPRRLVPWVPAPRLDYPTVNPPIHIFEAGAQ
jgi:hypothetical protein